MQYWGKYYGYTHMCSHYTIHLLFLILTVLHRFMKVCTNYILLFSIKLITYINMVLKVKLVNQTLKITACPQLCDELLLNRSIVNIKFYYYIVLWLCKYANEIPWIIW